MRPIHDRLFVGSQSDFENDVAHRPGWWVVHATKEPYHRQAVGYAGRDAPLDHPEYLVARRGHRLMLNLIDAPIEVDIPRDIYDAALAFICEGLGTGAYVLIHCEQGVSRSASVGMLYLRRYTDKLVTDDYREAEKIYSAILPTFSPGRAIRYFLRNHWLAFGPPPNVGQDGAR